MHAFDAYFHQHRDRHLDELREFVAIPSVSALPAHRADVARAAEWVAGQLRSAGISTVRIYDTPGHPIIYAEWLGRPGAPTILVYGHYDVQPPDPLDQWQSPPFVADIRDGRMYARGVSDDKGPTFIALKAAEAFMALEQALPLNVKFLLEGEEEVGSPNLRPFIEAHADLLRADVVVSADGAMWRPTEPSLTVGSKGLCALDIHVRGARIDLHSGRHGGGVPNALHALAELVAGLHDRDGRVAVAGFYDAVLPLSEEDRRRFAALPFDEDAYRRDLELEALVGEPGYSTLERQWARPTLEVNGMWGGFQGAGTKTVIPNEAHAKITCRLVPGQNPEQVLDLVEAHVLARKPVGVKVRVERHAGSSLPYLMPADHPALEAAHRVLAELYGKEPLYVRIGGTLPVAEIFQSVLRADTVFFSFSTADEQFHAPNEFFRLERLDLGLRAWTAYWQELATALPARG